MHFHFSIQEIVSAFLVLFAIIDITGSIPLIIELKRKGSVIKPFKVAAIAFLVLVAFLYGGEGLLSIFNVDIHAFAVAGAIILFIYGLEMTFGLHITNDSDGPQEAASIVPLVFPLIAGAGSLTTLVSIRAEYSQENIILAIFLNMLFVFFVLKYLDKFEKIVGPSVIYVLRKVFGVILLAIAIKLFVSNVAILF